jgi:hypothetical protein
MPETKIPGRYISNDLTNSNIGASAAIATSKLADSANFILRGGSVAFTADQSMGNNKLTNLATPTASGDAVTKAYADAIYNSIPNYFDHKPSARAASTANITISNPGTSSFDGVTLSANDLLLVKNQSTQSENGLYVFNGSGSALTRHDSMDSWTELVAALVGVEEGTAAADTFWLCTVNQGGTLGSTNVTFSQFGAGGGLSIRNFVFNETPAG